tara:strand:+ start:3843 stop:4142 length:300 start_codon:yes stop_codon:yes gene_type:complete
MQELVIIENSTIAAMLDDAEVVSQLPCLQNATTLAAKPKSGCGKCGRKNAAKAAEYTSIKNCLAGMASEGKRQLKKILNAKKVRIVYLNNSGRVIKLTF